MTENVIETVIRENISNGSQTFLSKTIARECSDRGTPVTGAQVGKYLHKHPKQFKKLKQITKQKPRYRWQRVVVDNLRRDVNE